MKGDINMSNDQVDATALALSQTNANSITGDAATIAAKTEFVRAYADGQKALIEAKADADDKRQRGQIEESNATIQSLTSAGLQFITNPAIASIIGAKAAQMTAAQTDAAEHRKVEAETQKRRDELAAQAQKRRDYLGATVVVVVVLGIGGLTLAAISLVSKGVIDEKSLAIVVGNVASAFAGLALGRRGSSVAK